MPHSSVAQRPPTTQFPSPVVGGGPPQTVVVVQPQSQALPALASFFFPGLGQLIQGRVGAAALWWFALFASALLMLVVIGFITTPILWIACIVDAARYQG